MGINKLLDYFGEMCKMVIKYVGRVETVADLEFKHFRQNLMRSDKRDQLGKMLFISRPSLLRSVMIETHIGLEVFLIELLGFGVEIIAKSVSV